MRRAIHRFVFATAALAYAIRQLSFEHDTVTLLVLPAVYVAVENAKAKTHCHMSRVLAAIPPLGC